MENDSLMSVSTTQSQKGEQNQNGVINRVKTRNHPNNNMYEIEKILEMKQVRGKKKYLVLWKGYEEPTWQEERTLRIDCPSAIQEFRKNRKAQAEVIVMTLPIRYGGTASKSIAIKPDLVSQGVQTDKVQDPEGMFSAGYKVLRVLDCRRGIFEQEYLVIWRPLGKVEFPDSWVSYSDLEKQCPELLVDYLMQFLQHRSLGEQDIEPTRDTYSTYRELLGMGLQSQLQDIN